MIADSKKTEFGTLFKKFAQEFLKKPEGQTHLLRYEEGRATGRANFNAIQAAKSRGEDTTDSVLRLLLPYTDSAAHRSSGVWVHVAPSIQGDVKEWFQQAGWTRPEDWPKVAEAILEFVSRCVEDPTSLQANCHDFDDLPYTTGFQTGLLTPILNALRPDEFMIVNSKSLRVINFFTAQALKQRLIDYAATNATGRALVSDISSDMQQYAASDGRLSDLFDMFSHWLVAIQKYPPVVGQAAERHDADFIPDQQRRKEGAIDEDIRGQITREDILDAIAALDRGVPHAFGPSAFYDLLQGGHRYPPKAVVGLAARRALGRALRPDEFSGGQESWAFRLLRERGFTIVDKERRSGGPELPSEPPLRVWIEDTKTTSHEHGRPGWEFGSCLWSPSAYEGGSDHYALMREPQIDDPVIHINNGDLVGWSYVAAPFRELKESPPSPGQWAGRASYYRIDLKSHEEFPKSIPLKEFVEKHRSAIRDELKEDAPKRYPFILYGEKQEVRHAQGAYLTRCTPKLYRLIRTDVFGVAAGASAQSANARYWAMSLGEGGRLWDECQEKGIVAIGWDEFWRLNQIS
jgi:hypothetical protein